MFGWVYLSFALLHGYRGERDLQKWVSSGMVEAWSLEALQEWSQQWPLSSCKAPCCLSFGKHGQLMHGERLGRPRLAASDQVWAAEFTRDRQKLVRL